MDAADFWIQQKEHSIETLQGQFYSAKDFIIYEIELKASCCLSLCIHQLRSQPFEWNQMPLLECLFLELQKYQSSSGQPHAMQ